MSICRFATVLVWDFTEQDPFNTSNKARSQRSGTSGSRIKKNPRDKKAELLAKEAAEYAKKHGVCSFHVPLGPLFVGKLAELICAYFIEGSCINSNV